MKAPGKTIEPDCQTDSCVARSVVDTLAREPGLEAITIDAAHEKISVATLGRAPEAGIETLTRRVSDKIHGALESRVCGLLEGAAECHACEMPLSPDERRNVIIRHDGASTTISRATCPTAPSFWRWRDLPLPRVVPRNVELPENAEQADAHINEWKGQMVAAIFCGVFALAGALAHGPFKVAFFAAAYVAGSFHQIEEIWERLREKAIDVHFLMIAVAVGAACIGAWAQGAILLFLFSLSGALEHFALGRTQKEIRSLFRDAPKFATVIDRLGGERETRVEELRAGMRLLVKPGGQFPVDGEVAKGATAADESNLTGESAPVEKARGQTVLAGTINLWGAVEMIVARPAAESARQRIIKLIREAQQQKAPSQRFTDKFSAGYTYFALGLSVVMFFVWWLGFHLPAFSDVAGGRSAFYRTMTLLVVSSPCALVLSIPSAILAAIAFGARHGILFRGGAAVEKLADVKTVALDKTGTLTTGELRVEKVETFPVGREKELARLAYSIEKLSTHPLARAITLHGKQQGLDALPLARFESITGEGLRAHWNGNNVLLGRRGWILSLNGSQTAMTSDAETHEGVSEVWIACGDLLGRILLRDDIRPQAGEVVKDLRREQLRTVVLTGDKKSSAENLKARLGLDDVRAELKPEDKVAAIRSLSARERVAMVGDGVNDAPSLAAAHIGVAMGARGSDAALEQADVVLMHDRLENFLFAYRLSRRARAIIRWNLFISLGTVAVLVTLALLGKIPLTTGVVGHEGSTVVVVMNSLRLLFGGNYLCKPGP